MSLSAEHSAEKTFKTLAHIRDSPDTVTKYALIKRLEWESRHCPKHKSHLGWSKEVHREKSFLHQDVGCSMSPKYNCLPDCHLKKDDFKRFVVASEEERGMISGLEQSDYRGKQAINLDMRRKIQYQDGFVKKEPEWNVMKGKRDPALFAEAGMEGNLFSGMGNNRNMFFNVKKPGD